ncbi:MAG: HD domain-containing protein, partial [Myxococcota bacterium]|nr:HD domain-containing protein [Myxococcota bacterium]
VKRALDRAAVWHRDQKRKYPGVDVPYVSHPAGVALLLARHGFDEEVVAAGALHDVIEDCRVSREELAALFGDRVAELVHTVSEADDSLPWEERKTRYLDRLAAAPWEAQAIGIADKIDNFLSIVVCARDHGDPWRMFNRGRDTQMSRFEAFAAVAALLPPHPLVLELDAALAAVRALAPPPLKPGS